MRKAMPIRLVVAAIVLTACASEARPTQPSPAAKVAEVRISNSHLSAVCLNGTSVKDSARDWRLAGSTSMVFTMRNDPRPGIENQAPGLAAIEFAPLAGHRYEIEVRGDTSAFSRRVWPQGQWKPVVRDRTIDQIISGEPRWIDRGCQ